MKQILAMILAVLLLVSCSKTPAASGSSTSEPDAPKAQLQIAALKGPTAMGLVKLLDDAEKGESINKYEVTLAGAPDELTGKIISGELDIAAVPVNLAATLYNKTQGGVKIAAINTLGVLYIVESGESVQSVADLKGKTLYSTGQGASPEYTLSHILEQNGIADEVQVEFKNEHAELAALLAQGKAELALLPQPFVTTVLMQNEKLRVALDLTQEWSRVSKDGSEMLTGCIVVQQKLIDENPQALSDFLQEYEASVSYVTDPANLDAAASLIVAQDILASEVVAKAALPACGITFLAGEPMKKAADGFLKVLFDADAKSVGGALPGAEFYYVR